MTRRGQARRGHRRQQVVAALGGALVLALPTGCTPAPQAGAPVPTATQTAVATPTPTASTAPSAAPPSATTAPTKVSPARPGATPVAACRRGDLKLTEAGSSGHAGSETDYLVLTNRSDAPCALSGFPTIGLVDPAGRTLPVRVRHHLGAHRVVLAPGGAAWTAVTLSHVPRSDDEGAPCEPPAAALWVGPPGDPGRLTAEGPWRACGGVVDVDSFTAGRPPAA
ncbi:DUF4232 domain-containing protein [Micromonospora sp. NPDC051300]|uniref:DUF4232 domain-containing protein n=1 Tax=Micromonospora sp. NPDC051300 TaxID=3364286 RepID=UPI0037960408